MARTPRAESPTRGYPVRLSDAERRRVAEAVRVNRQTFADFCRDAILTAAAESLESGIPEYEIQRWPHTVI